jgi:hypothetical protein
MLKSCEWCGQEFHTYKRQQRCCSRTCGRTLACREAGQSSKVEMTCGTCGKTFMEYESNKKSDHVYCSQKCAAASRTKKPRECLVCGEATETQRNAYCSHSCANKARWKVRCETANYTESELNAARHAARRDNPTLVKCEHCSAENVRLVRHHPDYDRPSDVVVLCEACHRKVHGYPAPTVNLRELSCAHAEAE